MRLRTCLLLILTCAVQLHCAGDYTAKTRGAHNYYHTRQYQQAVTALDESAKERSKDQLLYLMDRGMFLHTAGRWNESNKALLKAYKLYQQLETVSISEEAGALLTNERNRNYRGEDFEKVMINVLLAINFTMLGEYEDALVECRRVNEVLKRLKNDGAKTYNQLEFARYLSALLYESDEDLDAAYIDYKFTHQLYPEMKLLGQDLITLAKKLHRLDDLDRWKKEYPKASQRPLNKDSGELVVLLEAGVSPIKYQFQRKHEANLIATPAFRKRPSQTEYAAVLIDDKEVTRTHMLTNLEAVAFIHLEHRIGKIVAKAIASTVIKGVASSAVGSLTGNKNIGNLVFMISMFGNKADLRSWRSLPATLQVARVPLDPGDYVVWIEPRGSRIKKGNKKKFEIKIRAGKKTFISYRGF